MYINPFVFGVLTTLFVEMALYIGVMVYVNVTCAYKSKYSNHNNTNAKRRSQGGNYNG